MFSCEICKIFKNTHFKEHLRTTAYYSTEAPAEMLFKSRAVTFQKNLCYLPHCKPFKNDEKYFLFCLKSSFHFQDI